MTGKHIQTIGDKNHQNMKNGKRMHQVMEDGGTLLTNQTNKILKVTEKM